MSLTDLLKRAEWMGDAACKHVDPNLFFPERGASLRIARAMCAECPVRLQCLEYALDNNETCGVWGGASERERRTMRRRRRPPVAPLIRLGGAFVCPTCGKEFAEVNHGYGSHVAMHRRQAQRAVAS